MITGQLGDAEVEQLDVVAIAGTVTKKDVLGLEVAVNNALGVTGGKRARALHQDGDRLADGDAFAPHARRQAFSVEEFHDDVLERDAIERRFAKVDDVDDVRVADVVDGLGFIEEALHDVGLASQLFVQDFDRHALADRRVHAEIHRAHPAFANLALDVVVPQSLADKRHRH